MEDTPPVTTELAALRAQMLLMQDLLAAKDRELAAKEETLILLREKAARQERPLPRVPASAASDPMEGFRFVSGLDDPWAGAGGRGVKAPRKAPAREAPPQGLWARFYHWFREA